MLKDNLDKRRMQIFRQPVTRVGRNREDVTLIAVSKTKPMSETLQEAYDLGVRVFGENKVQETDRKIRLTSKRYITGI